MKVYMNGSFLTSTFAFHLYAKAGADADANADNKQEQ